LSDCGVRVWVGGGGGWGGWGRGVCRCCRAGGGCALCGDRRGWRVWGAGGRGASGQGQRLAGARPPAGWSAGGRSAADWVLARGGRPSRAPLPSRGPPLVGTNVRCRLPLAVSARSCSPGQPGQPSPNRRRPRRSQQPSPLPPSDGPPRATVGVAPPVFPHPLPRRSAQSVPPVRPPRLAQPVCVANCSFVAYNLSHSWSN
jgi:hypothetical protein